MREKILILFIAFFSIITYSQKKPKQLYQIIISKSDEKDWKNRDFIKIDSLGNVFSSNKETGEKINLISFNKALDKFVTKGSGVIKIHATNGNRPIFVVPGRGRFTFEITLSFLEDYHNEKEFKTKTQYELTSLSDTNQRELFLKYLSKEDRLILEKFLH